MIRHYLGYDHIPQRFAARVNAFTHNVLSPYLNLHRPCLFPTEHRDPKGRIRRRYRDHDTATPLREAEIPARRNALPQARGGPSRPSTRWPTRTATSTPPVPSMQLVMNCSALWDAIATTPRSHARGGILTAHPARMLRLTG